MTENVIVFLTLFAAALNLVEASINLYRATIKTKTRKQQLSKAVGEELDVPAKLVGACDP